MRVLPWLLPLVLMTGLAACSNNEQLDQDAPAADVAGVFYRLLRANPEQDQLQVKNYRVFRLVLQQSLWQRLEKAQISAATGHSAPTGSIFTSYRKGMTDFTIDHCITDDEVSRCWVQLQYVDQKVKESWMDGIQLRHGRLGWQVEDIAYDIGADWKPTGSLVNQLDTVLAPAHPAQP